MSKIINIFNSLNMTSKVMIILLFVLVILLIVFALIYAFKSDSDNNQSKEALEFLEEIKKEKENNEIPEITKGEQKEEVKSNKVDIKSITDEMSKDIEKNNSGLTEFEIEQEEKAIISYDELLKKVKENELNNIDVQEVDLDDRGYNLEDEFTYNTEVLDFDDILENKEEIAKNTNLEPIGKIDSQSNVSNLVEQTNIKSILDLDEVDDDLYTGSEFLSALKELRDSLE